MPGVLTVEYILEVDRVEVKVRIGRPELTEVVAGAGGGNVGEMDKSMIESEASGGPTTAPSSIPMCC